ncbi:hypothetical protein Pst134EA_019131 [Puccinia striiformis f. sp. tritici]|uniref:hypothetical protein n=1 Tax=Puccinia striiformis f. sp. tritici TaxID=168172 RepID=UPI002008A286|nr:hypothetical protein Pst134EA_019131 [Puccinia striiformis f. sp. tritici]KAH9458977.1 hypothetical protein Pst134EA_019131 [Puccinia striiformis f. sp. tritici]KAI9613805.1 hypothetical protein H4Q26_009654 [Puccinia striiformis f. sp. tritici PST-130]
MLDANIKSNHATATRNLTSAKDHLSTWITEVARRFEGNSSQQNFISNQLNSVLEQAAYTEDIVHSHMSALIQAYQL